MDNVTGDLIPVGDKLYHRVQLYDSHWNSNYNFTKMVAAPFGGPLLLMESNNITIISCSGRLISTWKWKNNKILSMDWTLEENIVFVLESGYVLIYNMFGNLQKSFSMGQEAKDVKIASCEIFTTSALTTGVSVCTTSNRIYVISSVKEPNLRKMTDSVLNDSSLWTTLSHDPRNQKILFFNSNNHFELLTHSTTSLISLDLISPLKIKDLTLQLLRFSRDRRHLAILFSSGILWLGEITESESLSGKSLTTLPGETEELAWISNSAVLSINSSASSTLVTLEGDVESMFINDFIGYVSEIDGLRLFAQYSGQEFIQSVPKIVEEIFKIGSMAPSSLLHLAAEEFNKRSHRADEYLRLMLPRLNEAIHDVTQCATYMFDPHIQKSLMKSAQFGESFRTSPSSDPDAFSTTCKIIRVLNALRSHKLGIPLSIHQYTELSLPVVIDRLLNRRLYPIAIAICNLLQLSESEPRILAHWAIYKINSCRSTSDASLASKIRSKFSGKQGIEALSYTDIAVKAAEAGRKQLAINLLLEHEGPLYKTIPLLLTLDEESTALIKALNSGDRDLIYLVLFTLANKYSLIDFHIFLQKYPLGKNLYKSYTRINDENAYKDWLQRDDSHEDLGKYNYNKAWTDPRHDSRLTYLYASLEAFNKVKTEGDFAKSSASDALMLLKFQSTCEDKFRQGFVGRSLHDTLSTLLSMNENKMAEKMKNEFKIHERRYILIKIRTLALGKQWTELKALAKTKRSPVSPKSILQIVRQCGGGNEEINAFLVENILNTQERLSLLTEFGMYDEAAFTAFSSKNFEALIKLESLVENALGSSDILQKIMAYKVKLLGNKK